MEFLIPSRTARPGDDPIFTLNTEARARSRAGESILNATVGALLDDEGKLAVLPTVAKAMREVPPEVTAGYAPIGGSAEFLRGVVDDLLAGRSARDQAVAVATPGGTGALRHAIANFVEASQSVLTTSYYWGPYKTLCEEADRHITTFRMFDEEARLDHEDLDRRLGNLMESQGRALVILNSPCHNPTGYSFDEREWAGVAEVLSARAKQGPVAVQLDVAYARYGAGLSTMLDAMLPLAKDVLVLFAWSASKTFLEYGARVGACVAVVPDPDERTRIHNALVYSCRGTWSNCNAGGMAAIARVVSDPELRAKVDAERDALRLLLDRRVARWNELAGPAGLRYPRYDGGFFTTVFCDDAHDVAAALRRDGIFVVPQTGALRVALCSVAERDVERLVRGLREHVSPGRA